MRIFTVGGLLIALALAGCVQKKSEREGYGPGEIEKWQDPNFKIIGVGSYNYTDYDIGTIFLLPPDKNDIDFAASTAGERATRRDQTTWQGGLGSGANLAWDLRWKPPKKFKVWWFRVVDKAALDGDPSGYDAYTNAGSGPGGVWCEYEIEVKEKFGEPFGSPFPQRYRDQFVLHFYPDGTVQGRLEFGAGSNIELEDIAKRDALPKLSGRPCLKETSNPFFGKKRPIIQN